MRPAFADAYGARPASATTPMIDPMLTMRPHPRRAIEGPIARAQRNGPFRFVSTTASQSASDSSFTGPRTLTPALLNRMSIPPRDPSTSFTSRVTSSDEVTSAANARARRPVAEAIVCAAASPDAIERLAIATSAPACASAVAMT